MQSVPFKSCLSSDKPLCGVASLLGESALVEIAAAAGIDFLFVDMEHGRRCYDRLESVARTAQGCGLPAVARLPHPDAREVARLLEIGYCGTILPHANTVAQVEALVAASYYPPRGTRSFATCTRTGRYGAVDPVAFTENANENIIVGLMMEDREAVENADALLSVPGVNLAFIGRADLSLSMLGRLAPDDPAVVEATRRIVGICRNHGVASMIYVDNAQQVALFHKIGVQLFLLAADTDLWLKGCQEVSRTLACLGSL
jgi:4-hydroxy-2-oxoheptanedioate aldolase